jgi:putative transposase
MPALHDEWEGGDRRYFSEASMLELTTMNTIDTPTEEVSVLPEFTAG